MKYSSSPHRLPHRFSPPPTHYLLQNIIEMERIQTASVGGLGALSTNASKVLPPTTTHPSHSKYPVFNTCICFVARRAESWNGRRWVVTG